MRSLMRFEGDASEPAWFAVNDGVMGGHSRGSAAIVEGTLQFSGDLSLANKGGFSSVRAQCEGGDFADAAAVLMRVRGDGRNYQLRLATDARFRGVRVSYAASFTTLVGQWTEIRVPFAELRPVVRGKPLDGPAFAASRVREIGLLIGDRREGPFALSVDWIGVE